MSGMATMCSIIMGPQCQQYHRVLLQLSSDIAWIDLLSIRTSHYVMLSLITCGVNVAFTIQSTIAWSSHFIFLVTAKWCGIEENSPCNEFLIRNCRATMLFLPPWCSWFVVNVSPLDMLKELFYNSSINWRLGFLSICSI